MRKAVVLSYLCPILSMTAAAATIIVNVSADVNDVPNPAMVMLAAGTYTVTPIGISGGGAFDAYSNWASTTCAQPSGCAMTTPTSVTGWRTAYDVISVNLALVTIEGILQTTVSSVPTGLSFFGDFFLSNSSETRYHVDDGTVYPTAATALPFGRSSAFTLSAASVVGFAITDIRPLSDNRGGISLLVSTAGTGEIPEPSTVVLSLLGLAAVIGRRSIKKWASREQTDVR